MLLGIYSCTLGRGTGEGSGSASDECPEWRLVHAGIWLLIELYQMLGTCPILFEEGLSYLREQLIMCLPRLPLQSYYSTQASCFSPEAVV